MRKEAMLKLLVGLIALSALSCSSEKVGLPTLTWLGTLRWMGILKGTDSEARGVSADGRVVVGIATTPALPRPVIKFAPFIKVTIDFVEQHRAFLWTAKGGMRNLGTLGGKESWALDVSADGRVVVGIAKNASGQERAFRWTASGGMQDLGTLGGKESWAWGVSVDGRVVVGWAENASGQRRAFRWTAKGGMQDLGTLGGKWSRAEDVSTDGRIVVGVALNTSGQRRAFLWMAEGGMQDLGTLGGKRSEAYSVSADGRVVVGYAENAFGQTRAFLWRAGEGMKDLNQVYAKLLRKGSYLIVATAISPDGRFIVGEGYNAATGRVEAFLLDTGAKTSK